MKQSDIQKQLDELAQKKFSKFSDAKLISIDNLITTSKEIRSRGGHTAVVKMNNKNEKNGHFETLRKNKIGKPRDENTKKKLKEGSKHSWREVSQYTKDGKWIKDWPNFVSIKDELGFNHTNICACCQNKPKYKSAYGFIWKYKK
jgi:hypothetical protein